MGRRAGTYSIVAADPATGEVGVAVQSKYFCVGAVVPWAKAGVGAVASQASVVAGYGPQVLALLERGLEPAAALERALAGDESRETRQLAAVTASGAAASFTGSECLDWAGAVQGDGYAAQGNILAGEPVVRELGRAYEQTDGPLAERLMAALEAAEEAGGDKRGRQAAALIVERSGAAAASRHRVDRVVDLRVDDHPEPIAELRRLLGIHTVWHLGTETYTLAERGEHERARELLAAALPRFPDDATLLYNLSCMEALTGRADESLDHLRRALAADPGMRAMAEADPDLASLKDRAEFRTLTGAESRTR